jgi:orotate phosphoribosyltransferase
VPHTQQVEKELQIPVLSIVRLKHLVSYVRDAATALELAQSPAQTAESGKAARSEVPLLERVESYRAQYGVDY